MAYIGQQDISVHAIDKANPHEVTKAQLGLSDASNIKIQETEPVTGVDGDFWYKPTTNELKVYDGGTYETQSLSDGYF